MRIPEDFWCKSKSTSLSGLEIDDLIIEVEKKYNIELPELYKQLLQLQDGGYINYSLFSVPPELQLELDEELAIYELYGSSALLSSDDNWVDGIGWDIPEKNLVLFQIGAYFITLDYRNTRTNPPVSCINMDTDYDGIIAKDFESFFQRLKKEK